MDSLKASIFSGDRMLGVLWHFHSKTKTLSLNDCISPYSILNVSPPGTKVSTGMSLHFNNTLCFCIKHQQSCSRFDSVLTFVCHLYRWSSSLHRWYNGRVLHIRYFQELLHSPTKLKISCPYGTIARQNKCLTFCAKPCISKCAIHDHFPVTSNHFLIPN
jgi:hypothetical protein